MNIVRCHVLVRHICRLAPLLPSARRHPSIRLSYHISRHLVKAASGTLSPGRASAVFSTLPHYSALDLEKAPHVRDDPAALEEAKKHAAAQLVPVLNGQSLITTHDKPRAVILELQKASMHLTTDDLVFLGLQGGTPVFSAACKESITELVSSGAEVAWVDLRRDGPRLDGADAALLALAQALVRWNRSNAFSAATGEAMVSVQGGHARVAEGGKGRIVYPRIDPAAIMLVSCGDYVLLGRQSRWAPGRYSCLAGFIEIGETLEMAVAREVQEEAGVVVDPESIRYEASQPWPFPQSLMVGFQAQACRSQDSAKREAALEQLKSCVHPLAKHEVEDSLLAELALPTPAVDTVELEDARWFHLTWLERQLSNSAAATSEDAVANGLTFSLPGSYALAHTLISSWTAQQRQNRSHLWKEDVESVDIDQTSTYKYVLLRLQSRQSKDRSRLLVRGRQSAGYHRDIVQSEQQMHTSEEIEVKCIGGGRIAFHTDERRIEIYGYSSEYDQAPHSISAALIRARYPFHAVTVSYSGY